VESMSFDELEGILDEVAERANREWREVTRRAIEFLAGRGQEFTADDVWALIEPIGVTTHEPNAMGAMFNHARRDGLIESDGIYRPSTRRNAHRRMVRVWRAAA
jgi:hypothetical protein